MFLFQQQANITERDTGETKETAKQTKNAIHVNI